MDLLDELEEPEAPVEDLDELDGPPAGELNGATAKAEEPPPDVHDVRVAKVKAGLGETGPKDAEESPEEESEPSIDKLLGVKQSAIADFDDEFRMEGSD
jgi:hypothetical protein